MGILLDRAGTIAQVVVGDSGGILLPVLPRQRGSQLRLRGLRLVHTRFGGGLNQDDLSDLILLRLDLVASLEVDPEGLPGRVQLAHLRPGQSREGEGVEHVRAAHLSLLDFDGAAVIEALEEELARSQGGLEVDDGRDRALLLSVGGEPKKILESSLEELAALALSAGVEPVDRIAQQVRRVNPRFLMGRGKLTQVAFAALNKGANLLLFDQELSPTQARNLGRMTELRILDRTQLILDIFAQRARSHEGKLQVEMAQLRYRLPHLADKDNALSRLTGGIGARGPGETRLEIDRRRTRDRVTRLGRELKRIRQQREGRRKSRRDSLVPVISIVGYTNAGKSTLLNTLTSSGVHVEDRLFATLDPTTRRLRLPREREVIITDTVGFIRNLPQELIEAFRATLEELEEADLLLHLIDASEPGAEERIEVVEELLKSLDLESKPCLKVFNKADLAEPGALASLQARHNGPAVSALDRESLIPLVEELVEWCAERPPAE